MPLFSLFLITVTYWVDLAGKYGGKSADASAVKMAPFFTRNLILILCSKPEKKFEIN